MVCCSNSRIQHRDNLSKRRWTMAQGRQIMCWADVKLLSAQPRVRRLFLTSMPTFLAWAYTILPGLVKNYSLPAQVSGNNYGTLVYTARTELWGMAMWESYQRIRSQVVSHTEIGGPDMTLPTPRHLLVCHTCHEGCSAWCYDQECQKRLRGQA